MRGTEAQPQALTWLPLCPPSQPGYPQAVTPTKGNVSCDSSNVNAAEIPRVSKAEDALALCKRGVSAMQHLAGTLCHRHCRGASVVRGLKSNNGGFVHLFPITKPKPKPNTINQTDRRTNKTKQPRRNHPG